MSRYEFQRNFAVIIAINDYSNGIPPLETAVPDARELARILKDYQYNVRLLLNNDASLEGLNQLIAAFKQGEIPISEETVKLTDTDRVLFYFAGHGIALDALENEDGPSGYLVPADAQLGNIKTYLLMQELHDALLSLPCRHLLVILDCCFAGAFRWSSHKRNVVRLPTIYKERYDRFIQDRAWQVITSAAHDQKALDFLANRGQVKQHSPFAAALFEALGGDADIYLPGKDDKPVGDGVITATELYFYLREKLETTTEKLDSRQTPILCHLPKHDKGEYIFLVPGHELNLPPAPPLNCQNNPYRGLESFDETHTQLFFGRKQLTEKLSAFVCDRQLTVVSGASGTGKSSLVKAGLIPQLRNSDTQQWHILKPIRPGGAPMTALSQVRKQITTDSPSLNDETVTNYQACGGGLEAVLSDNHQLLVGSKPLGLSLVDVVTGWCKANPQKKLLLIIDQFEELVTMCHNDKERKQFLSELEKALKVSQFCIVLTLRSDFEPQFLTFAFESRWMDARFTIPPMTQNELREVIEKPAAERVLYFEPVDLVERLINEVVQMPGALPLLSFTLSELYFKYLQRRGDNRALTEEDYRELGGVVGSLTQRATQEYKNLVKCDPAYEHTIRKVMLRMVAVDGGGLARRRLPLSELEYPDPKENHRVKKILQRFTDARLIVGGTEPSGEPYVEPAHDALVRGWDLLQKWKNDEQENKGLLLRQRLTPAVNDWYNLSFESKPEYLWNNNPRLDALEKVLKSPVHQNWLNQRETEFVKNSIDKRKDELEETKERLRISQQQEQIALARLLATQAQLMQREDISLLQSSVLLAVESMKRFNRVEMRYLQADQTLRQGLSLLPRSILRITKKSNRRYACSQSFTFCSDGKHMAIANDRIQLLEITSGRKVAGLEYEQDLTVATLSPDGQYAATCGQDGVVKIWQLSCEGYAQIPHCEEVQNIVFSPDSRYIVVISGNLRRVWQLTGSLEANPVKLPLVKLPDISCGQSAIAFSADGNYLAEFVEDSPNSEEGRRQVWELASGRKLIHETVNLSSPSSIEINLSLGENIDDMAFSSDSKYFVATVTLNTVKVWKLPSGEEMMTVQHSTWINTIAISPDGQYIAAGDKKGEAVIWKVPYGYQVAHLTDSPTTWLGRIVFSPDGQYLATAGKGFNKVARVYHVFRGREVARIIHENYVLNIAFSLDGKYIATQEDRYPNKGYSDTLNLWQIVDDFDGKILIQLDAEKFINHITVSARGKYLGLTCSQANSLQIYLIKGSAREISFIKHEGVHYAVFSTDEELVATVGDDKTVRIWELASDRELTSIHHDASIMRIAFSDDGKFLTTLTYLTSIYNDNIEALICDVIVWDLTTLKQVKHIENIKVVSISPDGKYLATLVEDPIFQEKTLSIQQVLKEEEVALIKLENEQLSEFTLSGDGKYLAGFGGFYGSDTSVDSDGIMQVWDLCGKEILPTIKLGRAVREVVFSPGSRFLAAAVGDNTVRIWDLINQQEVISIEVYGSVSHMIFSWNSEYLVTVNYLNQLQLWNLQPEVFVEEACSRLACNLTQEEWQLYLRDEPYQKTCPHLP
ncbi:hypothetical protein NUACC21_66440 [Scytonema sp. NUACC21]